MEKLEDVLGMMTEEQLLVVYEKIQTEIKERRAKTADHYENMICDLLNEIENDGFDVEVTWNTYNDHTVINITDRNNDDEED